jgi:hypothetical protein
MIGKSTINGNKCAMFTSYLYVKSDGCEILHHQFDVMRVKQCHKPPIWEWFIPPISGDLGMVYGIVLPE